VLQTPSKLAQVHKELLKYIKLASYMVESMMAYPAHIGSLL